MEITRLQNITFIGAGNVAFHLIRAFKSSGRDIVQVFTRSEKTANEISAEYHIDAITDISKLTLNAEVYVISVPDNAINKLLQELNVKDKFLVHTSGSLAMDILSGNSQNYGVFYPLQTFSRTRQLSIDDVPICIEAINKRYEKLLFDLAGSVSQDVRHLNSRERSIAHLAAVFASNFTNHMYSIAEEVLSKCDLPFDLLKPLIQETAAKVQDHIPHTAQTGPARRKDIDTIEKHLDILKSYPEFRNIYRRISEDIINRYKNTTRDDKL